MNLALLHDRLGQQEDAIGLMRHGLPTMRDALGERHPWTVTTARLLRQLLEGLGRCEEAAAVL